MADDSGLEVAALGGAPGVRSARYAGGDGDTPANNALLLKNLAGVTDRRARFTCVVVLIAPDGTEHVLEGHCPGRIAEAISFFFYNKSLWQYDCLHQVSKSRLLRMAGPCSRNRPPVFDNRPAHPSDFACLFVSYMGVRSNVCASVRASTPIRAAA